MSGPAKLYADFLANEGYKPKIDKDGDVVFKEEGRLYYIEVDTRDTQFFRIVFPNFYSIEGGEELARVMEAANHATMRTKAAKVYVRPDGKDTWASIELFFGDENDFEKVFARSMSAIRASVDCFLERVREEPPLMDE